MHIQIKQENIQQISGKYLYLFFTYSSCSSNLTGSSDDFESACYDSGNDTSGISDAGLWMDYTWIWIFWRYLNIDATIKKHNFL